MLNPGKRWKSPLGVEGDRLWLAEGYQIRSGYDNMDGTGAHLCGNYLADGINFVLPVTPGEYQKWLHRKRPCVPTPSRFMYRSLSRATFVVTGVKVERVQDISEEDAKAEGADIHSPDMRLSITGPTFETYRGAFSRLWDNLNAHRGYGWDANPWVFATIFEREA